MEMKPEKFNSQEKPEEAVEKIGEKNPGEVALTLTKEIEKKESDFLGQTETIIKQNPDLPKESLVRLSELSEEAHQIANATKKEILRLAELETPPPIKLGGTLPKKEILEKKEWGQEIETEIYIPFLTEILGDVFDFAVKTSEEVDKSRNGPKVDIIARFKKDGSHLAIQGASLELGEEGRKILNEKKEEKGERPVWEMKKICKDSGYSPINQGEQVPKIVLNFDHQVLCDAQYDWVRDGRKRRWFDYLKDRNEKEENKYKIDILEQMIEGLEETIDLERIREIYRKSKGLKKINLGWSEVIEPKLEILKRALEKCLTKK